MVGEPMAPSPIQIRLLVVGLVALLSLLLPSAGAGRAKRHMRWEGCDKIASPNGSDARGHGSLRRPFRSFSRLARALAPGETGCLRAGTYGTVNTLDEAARSGSQSARITIKPFAAEHVKLNGLLQIDGSYTTVSGFEIDGSNTFYDHERSGTSCPYPVSQGLKINGRGDVLEHNDYYQSVASLRGNGIGIGWDAPADNTIIRYNRIHDVGQCMAYDQIIYLASGHGSQIYDNWLWGDPHGWGIQIYPAASGAHLWANVIDQAGSGFALGGEAATSYNRIDHNVVMNSVGLAQISDVKLRGVAISAWWSGTPGTGNVFTLNDSFRNRQGIAEVTAVRTSRNITANPLLVDPAAHDYRPQPGSRLASWGLWNGDL
jgi:hypothetical protein